MSRSTEDGFEVLLLERPLASRFAAGAFVFPGGAVDEDDASPFWSERLPRTGEGAACAAALRELFEETGILPGSRGGGTEVELEAARQELLATHARFSEIASRFSIDFSGTAVAYFSRWITPRTLATRFDTRFFLMALDPGPVSVGLTAEHVSALWATPRDALDRFAAGQLPMLFPTRKTLERLAGFGDLDSALAALGEVEVEPILAKLDTRGDTVTPLMPGDAGYEETY